MAYDIHTVGVIGKLGASDSGACLQRLVALLESRGLAVLLEQESTTAIERPDLKRRPLSEIGRNIDLAIIVGGDGTLLNVARHLAPHGVPLIGINLGRVGFLTDIPAEDLEDELNRILDGDLETEQRFLLRAEVMRGGKIVYTATALNDVIINKGELARLIEFETFIDGEFVNSMRADGIIVATPTGSTAYALSAGGPILHPKLPAIELVPICPHTLSDRPIVVSSQSVAEIIITALGSHRAFLTLDGQATYSLEERDHIYVRQADRPVELIHPSGRNHYNVLRVKLHWGEKL